MTAVSTFGLGGSELAKSGTHLLMHNELLAGMGGPLETIGQWPKLIELRHTLKRRLTERRPDGAILVDTGAINLKLALVLRRFKIPTVYFIPPKVWVWRSGRLRTIARNIDLVLSILPFEEQFYAKRNIPFQYVGNPLLDQVPLRLTQAQAKIQLGIAPHRQVLTILPGSRHNEIRLQLNVFVQAAKAFMRRISDTEERPLLLIPAAPAIDPASIAQAFQSGLPEDTVQVVKGQSHICIKCARAALIKSGTSTLEAALLQVPMVLAYHSSRSAEWIFRHIVRYQGFVGLVNLFLEPDYKVALGLEGKPIPEVPEMILERCRPELIADKLIAIYRNGPERERMLAGLARIPALLAPPPHLGASPIEAAARAAWNVFSSKRLRENGGPN